MFVFWTLLTKSPLCRYCAYHFLHLFSLRLCCVLCSVAQSCLTLCNPMERSLPGSSVHGDSPGKNTGAGCHALLQGIFPTQGSNPGLPHCRWILYHLSHQGSPSLKIISCQFSLCYCSNILHKVPYLCMCQVHSVYSVHYFVALEEIRGDLWQLGMPIPGSVIKRHFV